MVTLIVALALGAGPITVENKMPCVVVNRMPAHLPMPARVGTVTRLVETYYETSGHTHTCANGHTWDHFHNPTHTCTALVVRDGKFEPCGATPPINSRGNYVADPTTPRKMGVMTTMVRVPITEAGPIIESPPVTRSVRVPVRLPQANCPNGNCPYVR